MFRELFILYEKDNINDQLSENISEYILAVLEIWETSREDKNE